MKVKYINTAVLTVAVLLFSTFSAFAQESEAIVVDEVIAQVNDGVITLSRVNRLMKEQVEVLVQQGKTQDAAKTEIETKKAELIANLINEELILQKGKEISVDREVDEQINQRIGQIMKEQNIKTINQLYDEMRKVNVNPEDFRENMRRQFTRDVVLQTEVDRKVYYGWSNKEIKDYYEKHKAKFTKPETVTLSDIFLSFAGRDESAVRAKADKLIADLRAGADFAKTAVENSDTPNVAQTKGAVGTFPIKELNEKIAAVIKDVPAGGVAKLETEEGVEIIRVDTRVNASNEAFFNENNVRSAMTYEILPEERKKYLVTLRKEAYIKIAPSYEAIIRPLLTDAETKAVATKPGK